MGTWPWIRRGLVVVGVLSLVNFIPTSIRPGLSPTPFTKSEQQITVPAGTTDLARRITAACKAPLLLRPLMGSAKSVTVISTENGLPQSAHRYRCP